jgi:hypothetical protein
VTKKRAKWLGETMRLDVNIVRFPNSLLGISFDFNRDWMLQASEDEMILKVFKPILRALRKSLKKDEPR